MSFFLGAAAPLATAESGIQESGDNYDCTILQWDNGLQISRGRTIQKACDIHKILPTPLTVIFAPSDEVEGDRMLGFRTLVNKFQIPGSFLAERNQRILNSFGYVEENKTSTCSWMHFLLKRVEHEEEKLEDDKQKLDYAGRFLHHLKRWSRPAPPRNDDDDKHLYGLQIPLRQLEEPPQYISSAFLLRAELVAGQDSPSVDPVSRASHAALDTSSTISTGTASHGQPAIEETPRYNITLICFDAPVEVQDELTNLVRDLKMKEALHHPMILWEIILYHLSMALDTEMWSLTRVFRTEQRNLGYLTARPSKALSEMDFSGLHLLADHMVLILEGARGLLATVEGLIDHHESSIGSTPGFLARKTRDALKYRLRYVQSITERGTTFEKRISNMISLFFSDVSLQDSGLMMRDSSSLRSIAFITLIFLPITTVATVCGSSFFYMAEHNDGSKSIQMDSTAWSMFFVSGLATCILIGVWIYQLKSLQRQFTRGRIMATHKTSAAPPVV